LAALIALWDVSKQLVFFRISEHFRDSLYQKWTKEMKEFKVSELVKVSAFIKSGWIKTIISKPERCLSFSAA
jgi:hypothetical protein